MNWGRRRDQPYQRPRDDGAPGGLSVVREVVDAWHTAHQPDMRRREPVLAMALDRLAAQATGGGRSMSSGDLLAIRDRYRPGHSPAGPWDTPPSR